MLNPGSCPHLRVFRIKFVRASALRGGAQSLRPSRLFWVISWSLVTGHDGGEAPFLAKPEPVKIDFSQVEPLIEKILSKPNRTSSSGRLCRVFGKAPRGSWRLEEARREVAWIGPIGRWHPSSLGKLILSKTNSTLTYRSLDSPLHLFLQGLSQRPHEFVPRGRQSAAGLVAAAGDRHQCRGNVKSSAVSVDADARIAFGNVCSAATFWRCAGSAATGKRQYGLGDLSGETRCRDGLATSTGVATTGL